MNITIYTASHLVDAHMVANLLEQYGIAAFVKGEYLQAAAGDLPVGQLIRVEVDVSKELQAKAILQEWESAQPASESLPAPSVDMGYSCSYLLGWCVVAFGLGWCAAYLFFVLLKSAPV